MTIVFLQADEPRSKLDTMTKTFKSKTRAATLALLFGVVGAHRFYLRGWRDVLGWLHLPLFAAGVWGVARFVDFGENDVIAEIALPLLGLIVGVALFQALLIGLTSDARWDARWNVGSGRYSSSGWGAVLVVVFALLIGTAALMGALAFGLQHYFQPGLGRFAGMGAKGPASSSACPAVNRRCAACCKGSPSGKTQSGQISANGTSTKARWCMRG